MNTVKVDKYKLLTTVKENREKHRDTFLTAQEGYRHAVIEELDRMLQDARNNKKIRVSVGLIAPQDMTNEYDNVIAMLEMSVDTEITLSSTEFSHYVRDDWSWKRNFTETCNYYFDKTKEFRGFPNV